MAIFESKQNFTSAPIAVATKAQIFISGSINGTKCVSGTDGLTGEVVIQVQDESGVYRDTFIYPTIGNYELSFVSAKNIQVDIRNCYNVTVQVDVAA